MHAIARSGLRDPQGIDNLSTAAKPKEYMMKSDSRSADAFGRFDIVVGNAGLPNVAPLTPWHKDRLAARSSTAMLAFVAGLLVAAIGAWGADAPVRPEPTTERAGADSVRVQPTARQFAPPNQPDISASGARAVDELYRLLTGPQPATFPDSASSTSASSGAKR
jgi:hypothetical protein